MRKIPTLFVRDPEDRAHVLPEVHPECGWVLKGEGTPTRKWDGTCVMLDASGLWWARREVRPGKAQPPGYLAISTDEVTGRTVGWEPIEQSSFAKLHAEAVAQGTDFEAGTYELLGPRINRNPDGFDSHVLIRHGTAPSAVQQDCATAPRDFDGLRSWLLSRPYEGLVWHHEDGRMAKLKARDFR